MLDLGLAYAIILYQVEINTMGNRLLQGMYKLKQSHLKAIDYICIFCD